ncbi:MAG: DUF1223 domain-containing protein [Chitinophagaceae bacterium]
MRPICTIPFVGIMILAGLSFSISGNKPGKEMPIAGPGFAVVELFTSEGCSSCPPADELAIALSKEYVNNVYFLGYHVDYWDYIGWKDKFSKADYTERQRKYATAFNLSSIYTPQVVVNGRKEFIGSDQSKLRKAIMEELKVNPSAEIKLTAKLGKDGIVVSYATSLSDRDVLKIALVQIHAETPVKRGENSGKYLSHINVVREIQSIGINKKGSGETYFKIPGDVTAANLKIIAFIQGKDNLKIVGATDETIQ